ncbi:hypothetical protein D3C85_1880870 [compost metagenome]
MGIVPYRSTDDRPLPPCGGERMGSDEMAVIVVHKFLIRENSAYIMAWAWNE